MMILREGLCPGLTSDIVAALKRNYVKTVVDLVASDLEELARKCFLSYKTLVAVRRVLLAQYSAFPSNGADLYEELKVSTAILPTGNSKLDLLLDSGLYTGEVTEIAGTAGCGKTQVCQSIVVNVASSMKQGVCYIDTTGGVTGSRLLQLIQSKTEQEDEQISSLQRIEVFHVFDVYKLLDVLQDLRNSLSQQGSSSDLSPTTLSDAPTLQPLSSIDEPPSYDALRAADLGFESGACSSGRVSTVVRPGEALRLLVIDSVCAVIYPLLGGKQTEGMAAMMHLAQELQTLARDHSLSVLVTNHVTKDSTSKIRPALGRSWSFVPSTRILLCKQEGNAQSGYCTASLVKSPRQPSNMQVEMEIGFCEALEESTTSAASALRCQP